MAQLQLPTYRWNREIQITSVYTSPAILFSFLMSFVFSLFIGVFAVFILG